VDSARHSAYTLRDHWYEDNEAGALLGMPGTHCAYPRRHDH